MAVDPLAIWNIYTQYIFGSVVITSLFFIIFVVLISIRYGWTLPTYVVVSIPLVYLVATYFSNINFVPIFLIGLGILLGIAMLVLIKR